MSYAAFDKQYLPYAQTTGIYECYCSERIGILTIYKLFSDPEVEICGEYVKMLDGGSLVTLPSGIVNGILTNVGAVLIIKVIPKIGFHSYHIQTHATMLSIFLLSYIIVGFLPVLRYYKKGYVPDSLNAAWYEVYGKMITTGMLISSFMPYASVFLKLLVRCCKKKENLKF